MAAKRRLLEKSRHKRMVFDFMNVFLSKSTSSLHPTTHSRTISAGNGFAVSVSHFVSAANEGNRLSTFWACDGNLREATSSTYTGINVSSKEPSEGQIAGCR